MTTDNLRCSFCGKRQNEVRRIITGPNVYICDECVSLCVSLFDDENIELSRYKDVEKSKFSISSINILKPMDIKRALDDYVIGQENAKLSLSVAVYNHYKRIMATEKATTNVNDVDITFFENDTELKKSNILLIGSTGTGKTLLAQTLAKVLNVPFAIADATTLTESGYVGEDVENILLKLIQASDFDIERAQKGIIYIDEIDKITRKSENPSITRDVSGEGVQQSLLKIIEGTVSNVPPHAGRKHPHQEFIEIDTTDILFICGGAFEGIDKIIQKRTKSNNLGFGADIKSKTDIKRLDILKDLRTDDLIKFGLIPELVGRLPITSTLDDLDEASFIEILTKPKNALIKQYKKLFTFDGVELEFTSDAIKAIVKRTIDMKMGARGLRGILENVLLKSMYEVPSMNNITKVVVDEECITGFQQPKYFQEK